MFLWTQGVLSDLFPGVTLPEHDYGVLQSSIEMAIVDKGLQLVPSQVHTCTYMYMLCRRIDLWVINYILNLDGIEYLSMINHVT